jgi:hypothetical protein
VATGPCPEHLALGEKTGKGDLSISEGTLQGVRAAPGHSTADIDRARLPHVGLTSHLLLSTVLFLWREYQEGTGAVCYS